MPLEVRADDDDDATEAAAKMMENKRRILLNSFPSAHREETRKTKTKTRTLEIDRLKKG